MKALLKILYFFLALIILVLLAGIFLPKSVNVDSSLTLKASPDIVFRQINNLRNWQHWLTWMNADTTMEVSYGSQSEGRGASYTWDSEKSGKGKITITQSEPNTRVGVLLEFGDMGNAGTFFDIQTKETGTQVTWTYTDDTLTYFERYFVVLFTNNMRNSMKRGLEQLRTVTEDLRLSRISEIKLIDLEAQPAIAIIDSAKAEHIDSLMKSMFASLRTYLDRRAIAPTGDPVRIYYTWNPEGLSRFACALPIEKRTWGWLQYQVIELPAGKAATIHHWGKTDSPKPYLALDDYLKTNNLEQGSFIWEIYITPPEATSDTSLWQKQVFYPVGLEM